MNSYKLTGIERLEPFDEVMPTYGDNDVLIKVSYVGVCGSDVHYYSEGRIGSQIVQYPWTIGHEGSGTVAFLGSKVADLQVGQPVVFDPASPCWNCSQCLSGRQHTCLNLTFMGCPGQVEGCLSEYVRVPAACCFPLTDGLSLESAAMVEPVSIAVYAASLYRPLRGASVAILGVGAIGMSLLQVVLAQGASRVAVTDKIDQRLQYAKSFGATATVNPKDQDPLPTLVASDDQCFDVVFECCGQQEALDDGIKLLKPGGELSIIGIPEGNRVSFDINLLRRKEIRVQNVRRQNSCMRKALEMISTGEVNVPAMITHRFNFFETGSAFDLVKNYREGVLKAMISLD